ncbi:MAG: thiopurine S-methyltransferase [Poseidonia sp.]
MEFWHNRWATEQIGWHKPEFNDLMVKHWPNLHLPHHAEVLVPMCGKSLDMVWLSEQGHNIVGLELVEQAVHSFFKERELVPEQRNTGRHVHFTCPPFSIVQGDLFELEPNTVQADAWYDRAAMIALPESRREAYVDQLRVQTKPGAVGLLITLTYPQEEMTGPPYAVHDDDVHRLFTSGFEVEQLERIVLEDERGRELSSITSSVFKITRT